MPSKFIKLSTISAAAVVSAAHFKPYWDRKYRYPQNSLLFPQQQSNGDPKLAVIIGGGVNGVSTAYELHKHGYKTVIIEAKGDVAEECSRAAWGGLGNAYAQVDVGKFNTQTPTAMDTDTDASAYCNFKAIHINWRKILFDPHFLRWSIAFLWHSNWLVDRWKSLNLSKQAVVVNRENVRNQMKRFVADAVRYQSEFIKQNSVIPDLREKCQMNSNGAILVTREHQRKECAKWKQLMSEHGRDGVYEMSDEYNYQPSTVYDCSVLDLQAISELIGDANLQTLPHSESVKYFKYIPNENIADAPKFCHAMKEYLTQNGHLTFIGDTKVLDFEVDSNSRKISKIYTDCGIIELPAQRDSEVVVVLSAGSWTPVVARKLELFVPVYPLKGYDFIIDYKVGEDIDTSDYLKHIPKHGIIDNFVFFANFGSLDDDDLNRIRIASIGQFDGWNIAPTESVRHSLLKQAQHMMPNVFSSLRRTQQQHENTCFCGLRPLTSDVSVICGRVKQYSNLYINVGPGYNGWKSAMGSAFHLGNVIVHKQDHETNFFDPHNHGVKKSPTFCFFVDFCSSMFS